MPVTPLETRDLALIMALRPYVSPPAQKIIDALLDLVNLQAEVGPDVFDPNWLKGHVRELAAGALPLGLIYVSMHLSERVAQAMTQKRQANATSPR